jgi:thymidylate synthase (FAD)
MKIIEQSYEILSPLTVGSSDCLADAFIREAKIIEKAGRTAYKSEGSITQNSYDKFIHGIIKRGDVAVLRFGSMAVKFVTDRGVSHELAQDEFCAFVQEDIWSCNYDEAQFGRELTVIRPSTWASWSDSQQDWWKGSLEYAELNYLEMVQDDMEPQEARSVLPNSLKTEIVVRADFLAWRRIFRLRALRKAVHPDMQALMLPLYTQCRSLLPCVFDIGEPE